MRLLIISNMAHYYRDGQLVGWGPTVQEINALAGCFETIRHIGCLHLEKAPASALSYQRDNIHFIPLPPAGGNGLLAKLGILQFTPHYLRTIWPELSKADVVHIRCPANIPLLALIALSVSSKPRYRWIKYAGNWDPEQKTAFSYGLQRWWIQRNLSHSVATVNGRWPDQPEHVYSFLNPCLTVTDLKAARPLALSKKYLPPYHLLYVGAINENKGAGRVLEIFRRLREAHYPVELDIVGDGQDRALYEEWSSKHGLQEWITFHGWVARDQIGNYYARAHFNLLPSESEGWPKVLSEGMAYGAVPLAGAVSCIPQVLDETGAGEAIPPLDVAAFVDCVQKYINQPQLWHQKRLACIESASHFTYTAFLQNLQAMFHNAWGIDLIQ
jgi:glycosyltransferase involved in cell wall biosynthesis